MNNTLKGLLINYAGEGRYTNTDAPEKLIRYVTRTNKKPEDDLVAFGGLGVAEFKGIPFMIQQFHLVQDMYTRRGGFGRYMDHEIYSFSPEDEALIHKRHIDVDGIARKMAYDIYERDQCQVVYGVHSPSGSDRHMHIHFAINTVNYVTGSKRRENKRQTRERGERFQEIVDHALHQES